jgi:hypothetical protein
MTLMVQLAPAATLAPQLLVSAKSLAFRPETAMLLAVKAALPELVKVISLAVLVVPRDWVPKANLVGEKVAVDFAPVPVSVTLCGLTEESYKRVTEAVRDPIAVGWKITLIAQLAPAATMDPQLLVCAKSLGFVPASAMLEMLKSALPALVRVMVWGGLKAPMGWLSIVMLVVERLGAGAASEAGLAMALPPPPQDVANMATAMQTVARTTPIPRSSSSFPVSIARCSSGLTLPNYRCYK